MTEALQLGAQAIGVGRVLRDPVTGGEYVVRQIDGRRGRVEPRNGEGGGWLHETEMGFFRIKDEREMRIDSPTLKRLPPRDD